MAEGQGEPDELVYLDFNDALEIFAAIVGGTPQQAADQLRGRDALEGALGRPASYAHYEQADVALQAAWVQPRRLRRGIARGSDRGAIGVASGGPATSVGTAVRDPASSGRHSDRRRPAADAREPPVRAVHSTQPS